MRTLIIYRGNRIIPRRQRSTGCSHGGPNQLVYSEQMREKGWRGLSTLEEGGRKGTSTWKNFSRLQGLGCSAERDNGYRRVWLPTKGMRTTDSTSIDNNNSMPLVSGLLLGF